VISGLLEDGSSLMSYLGCNGDAYEPTYGEACYNGGANGGLIPSGMMVDNTDPDTIDMCGSSGCQFVVTGNGCVKIRDFSSLPGFEFDTRQVFLFMDEHCNGADATKDPNGTPDTSMAAPSLYSISSSLLSAVLFAFVLMP